jgi:serine/threonine protein phosphatase 1
MLKRLRSIFPRTSAASTASVPVGQRVYAVGDIHGRLDLFEALIAAIEADDAKAGEAQSTVILLGDLVDRGPHSAGVLARAREWQRQKTVRILTGNHEEMFLASFDDADTLRHFLRFGGKETVLSYGIDRQAYNAAEVEEVQAMMREAVPQEDRDFIASFEDLIVIGDYLFVHAGIRPKVAFEESHGAVVVHGHTISDAPVERDNRIGIDTGAYLHGRLTALVLEGSTRRYIEAFEEDGGIATALRAVSG